MLNICVFVSGSGTNLQAIIDAIKLKRIKNANLALVISNNEDAYALERAKKNSIKTRIISNKSYKNREMYEDRLAVEIEENNIDLIVLAGFMVILSASFVERYPKKIINIHPSLIPSFCGDGFYGLKVHEAALERGVKLTGATVHFVNRVVDGGEIILQKAVQVFEGDTPKILQKRVMEQAEQELIVKAIDLICNNNL